MDREPKISELQNLIDHFRKTDREHELIEILERHHIKGPDELMEVVNVTTHEFSEEAIVVNKLAWQEGLVKKTKKPFRRLIWIFKNKWYARFAIYWIILFVFIFSALNAPIFIGRLGSNQSPDQAKVISYQELEEKPMAASAPLSPGEVVPQGSYLKVPKIRINAPIQFAKTTEEADIQKNLTKGVVHYSGTAIPGEIGNAFITGHSSNFWWIKGNYNYVFVNLDKLKVGDQAIIYHAGNKYIYQVSSKKVVGPDDVSVLKQTETPTLTLMTCTPPGTNWKRLIVRLDQISPKYVKPQLVTKSYNEPTTLPSTDTNSLGAWGKAVWQAIFNN